MMRNIGLKKPKQDKYSFNIYLKNKLIGGVSLSDKRANSKWELGYWIGQEYWGK
jgi:RimJ/RimL family protein N-acetyltransferase